jgi:hypothetical protein
MFCIVLVKFTAKAFRFIVKGLANRTASFQTPGSYGLRHNNGEEEAS